MTLDYSMFAVIALILKIQGMGFSRQQVISRLYRATFLVLGCAVTFNSDGTATVLSESDMRAYTIDLYAKNMQDRCTCKDAANGFACKHQLAAWLKRENLAGWQVGMIRSAILEDAAQLKLAV